MLGVRQTACNDIVQIELGISNAKSYLRDAQAKFINKITNRQSNTPVECAIKLAIEAKTNSSKMLTTLINSPSSFASQNLATVKQRVINATTTKRREYLNINPHLQQSEVYQDFSISEHHRVSYSRIRQGSHRLKIETGRWARIQRENRICPCGNEVQNEEHVLLRCPRTNHLRTNINNIDTCANLNEFFTKIEPPILTKFVYDVLKISEI